VKRVPLAGRIDLTIRGALLVVSVVDNDIKSDNMPSGIQRGSSHGREVCDGRRPVWSAEFANI